MPSNTRIDLITPWITIACIVKPPLRCFLLCAFAALLVESHSTIPHGLYLYVYAGIGSVLLGVRKHISWQSTIAIPVALWATQAWIFSWELTVILTQNHGEPLQVERLGLDFAVRMLVVSVLGLAISATSKKASHP